MVMGSRALRSIANDGFNGLIGPASIDLTLQDKLAIPYVPRGHVVTLGEHLTYREVHYSIRHPYILLPGEFVLGATQEKVDLPKDVCGFVQGRSSIGRIGLTVQNAGFIDPGFKGTITLELVNESRYPIALIPGYRVVQIVLLDVRDNEIGYEGKYNGQYRPTGSRMYLDKEAFR